MSRPIPRIEPRAKTYQVVVTSPDEQNAFEAMAAHQGRPDVGEWLLAVARAYVRLYFSRRMASDERAEA